MVIIRHSVACHVSLLFLAVNDIIILYDLPGCAETLSPIYKWFTVQLQPETTTIYLVKFFLDLAYLIHRQTF